MGSPPLRFCHACHDHDPSLTNPMPSNTCYLLLDTSAMTLSVEICGAEGWEDIKTYSQTPPGWFGP